jgi:hypothetical protein
VVEARNEIYSPSGKVVPLDIEWRVTFPRSTRGGSSVLGDKSKGSDGLQMRIVLKWRRG